MQVTETLAEGSQAAVHGEIAGPGDRPEARPGAASAQRHRALARLPPRQGADAAAQEALRHLGDGRDPRTGGPGQLVARRLPSAACGRDHAEDRDHRVRRRHRPGIHPGARAAARHQPIDFATLDLERLKAEVTDEEIAKSVERIRERAKRTEPVSPPRPAADGDTVMIDFEGRVDGELFAGRREQGLPA